MRHSQQSVKDKIPMILCRQEMKTDMEHFLQGLRRIGNRRLHRSSAGCGDSDGKAKPAKKYLRDFYLLPERVEAYSETDMMMGVRFLQQYAIREKKPLVICVDDEHDD